MREIGFRYLILVVFLVAGDYLLRFLANEIEGLQA
jgi:hypothetical protein